jgi:hypothetical protein
MNLIKLSTILYPSAPGPEYRKPDLRPEWVKDMDQLQADVELDIAFRNLIYFKTTGWHPGMQCKFYQMRKVVDVFTNHLWENNPDYNRCEHHLREDQSCYWVIHYTKNSNPRVLPKPGWWSRFKAAWESYWEHEGMFWVH